MLCLLPIQHIQPVCITSAVLAGLNSPAATRVAVHVWPVMLLEWAMIPTSSTGLVLARDALAGKGRVRSR
jgi:predicted Abi (CAAX) family protease